MIALLTLIPLLIALGAVTCLDDDPMTAEAWQAEKARQAAGSDERCKRYRAEIEQLKQAKRERIRRLYGWPRTAK